MSEFAPIAPWRLTFALGEDRAKRRGDTERLIRWYFGPTEAPMALWVAWNVSGMEPLAFHRCGGMGVGLFAVTPKDAGLPVDQEWTLHNPIRNVAVAHRLWCTEGWSHWEVPPLPRAFDGTETGGGG